MKRRACGPKWKKTLYWIIWNRFEDNWLYALEVKNYNFHDFITICSRMIRAFL